jgi:AcrR family transcriptional regulator
MGLRELKAERTRAALSAAATELFLTQGYDETTMEQIAEKAEVGASTLYRYFASKELLLLDWLVQSIEVGEKLRLRPRDEPLPVALRAAILEAMHAPSPTGSHANDVRLRRIIDDNPGPRARLWDFVMQARTTLEEEVGARLGRPADDMLVLLTARSVDSAFYLAAERMWDGDGTLVAEEVLDEVLDAMHTIAPILPATVVPAADAKRA